MVLSKISKKEYDQNDIYVDPKDLDQDSYIYNGYIYGKAIQFVLGIPRPHQDGEDFTILYIYLVKDEEVLRKIGVIEFETINFQALYDTNGDFVLDDKTDIMKTNCTLFPNAKTFIKTKYNITIPDDEDYDSSSSEESSESEEKDTTQEEEKQLDKDLDQTIKSRKDEETIEIKQHTKDDHLFEVAEYEKNKSKLDLWINKFLKSKKYDIDRVPGDGDCFFSAFVKAYNSSKHKDKDKDKDNGELKIHKIRNYLSEIADTELLNNYKAIYGVASDIAKSSKEKMSKGGKIHASYKAQIGGTNDLQRKKELIAGAKDNIQKIAKQKSVISKSTEVQEEYSFMKDINTLEQLKDFIKTNEFYADAWAIPNIEKKYNVKFIILDQSRYSDNPQALNSNVLQCGEAHPDLQRQGYFDPIMYIILNYSGNIHYDLITYDKNYFISSFKFKELPYIIKKTIIETCYEEVGGQGAFYLIQDVRDFAMIEGLETQEKPDALQELRDYKGEEKESLVDKLPKSDKNKDIILIIGKNIDKIKNYPVGKINNSFKTHFNCSKNSKDEPSDNQVILLFKDNKKELENYFEMCNKLDGEKEWRTKLDNHYEMNGGIVIDGKKYKSVQQYLDKIGNSSENRFKAIKAKFEQHEDLRAILLCTHNYLIKIKEPKQGRASLKEDAIEKDINSANELMEVRKYFQTQTQTLEK
tara:strand:+ start:89 stop:2176 length:2088 start_codon:yes stop_codon:yes gene_type:complete